MKTRTMSTINESVSTEEFSLTGLIQWLRNNYRLLKFTGQSYGSLNNDSLRKKPQLLEPIR